MRSTFLRDLYTNTPLTVAGLLIFFVVFMALFAWVYLRKGAKQQYEALGQLPLRNDGDFHD